MRILSFPVFLFLLLSLNVGCKHGGSDKSKSSTKGADAEGQSSIAGQSVPGAGGVATMSSPLPDLTIEASSISFSGGNFIYFIVKNIGQGDAGNFRVRAGVFGTDIAYNSFPTLTLPANSAIDIYAQLINTHLLTPGQTVNFTFTVDVNGTVAESDETNNVVVVSTVWGEQSVPSAKPTIRATRTHAIAAIRYTSCPNGFGPDWDYSCASTNAPDYELARSEDGTTWNTIATGARDNINPVINDTGLAAFTPYFYKLRFKNPAGVGPWSDPIATVTHGGFPAFVLNATPDTTELAGGSHQMQLQWFGTTVTGPYDVQHWTPSTGWVTLASPVTSSYLHQNLSPSTTYEYRVCKQNICTNRVKTKTLATIPAPSPEPAGTLLSLAGVVSSDFNEWDYKVTIPFTWTDVADETRYEIEASDDQASWTKVADVAQNATQLTLNHVCDRNVYYFRLRIFTATTERYTRHYTVRCPPLKSPVQLKQFAGLNLPNTKSVMLDFIKLNIESGVVIEAAAKLTASQSLDDVTWTPIINDAWHFTSYTFNDVVCEDYALLFRVRPWKYSSNVISDYTPRNYGPYSDIATMKCNPLAEWQDNYGMQAVGCEEIGGDYDGDGDVDGRDFLALQRGETPEPRYCHD